MGDFDPAEPPTFPSNPVRRDVILVNALGYAIISIRADNPGAWFLYISDVYSINGSSHCHIDWHVVAGMIAQFIEAPLEMQETLKVPQPIYDQCKMDGIPTSWDAYGEYGHSEMTLKIKTSWWGKLVTFFFGLLQF